MSGQDNLNPQQFFHATRWHDVKPGTMLTPGGRPASTFAADSAEGDHGHSTGQHVYLADDPKAAAHFAAGADWRPEPEYHTQARVFRVHPTGPVQADEGWGGTYTTQHPVRVGEEIPQPEMMRRAQEFRGPGSNPPAAPGYYDVGNPILCPQCGS